MSIRYPDIMNAIQKVKKKKKNSKRKERKETSYPIFYVVAEADNGIIYIGL